METGNEQPYWLAKTKSLYFNNNVSNLIVNSQTFFIKPFHKHYTKWNVKKNNRSNENRPETSIKNKKDAVRDCKAKVRRFIIYKLFKCLKLVRVYFVYSFFAVTCNLYIHELGKSFSNDIFDYERLVHHRFNFKKSFRKRIFGCINIRRIFDVQYLKIYCFNVFLP